MLNKKGFTMVELMVSISLISLIMIFLVKILIDVRYEGTNEIYDTRDQISRAEIIKTIQTDAIGKSIYSIRKYSNNIDISLVSLSGTSMSMKIARITVNDDKITYQALNNKTYSWPLELAEYNSDVKYSLADAKCNVTKDQNQTGNKDYIVTLIIPVYMSKSTRSIRENNNTSQRTNTTMDSTLDNITLTFYGREASSVINNLCSGF